MPLDWLIARLPFSWHRLRRWPGWAWLAQQRHRARSLLAYWPFVTRRLRQAAMAAGILVVLFLLWGRIGYWLWWDSYGLERVPVLGINFGAPYARWHAQRTRPVFVDRRERLVGLYPVRGATEDYPGDYAEDTYVTAGAGAVPEPWWRMVRALEDANRDRWFHVNGIDLSQLVKVPYRYLFTGAGISGGSTLEMQVIKVMHRDTDVTGLQLLLRKARDFLHAPMLAYVLARHPREQLRDWYAAHVPLLYEGDEHGLTAAAYLVFGKPASALSLAEQALLAGATKYHLGLSRAVNWDRARARGLRGLAALHAGGHVSEARMTRARAALRALRHEPMPATLAETWRRCADARRDSALARQLQGRAVLTAWPALIEAGAELTEVFGRGWWREVERVRLTLDLHENCATAQRIAALRRRAFPRMSAVLAGKDRRGGVYAVAAAADAAGRIVRFYSDVALPYYHRFGWRDGRLVLSDTWAEGRKVGSVGKVLAAVVAASEGDEPGSRYFVARREKSIAGLARRPDLVFQNFNGSTGFARRSAPGALITAREAFARSNNLAVMQRLAESGLDHTALLALVEDFGLVSRPPPAAAPGSRNLIVDIPMGNVHGSPRMLHRVFVGLQAGLTGGDGGACMPHIVDRIWRAGGRAAARGTAWHSLMPRSRVCRNVRRWLTRAEGGPAFLREVLAGVVDCDFASPRPVDCAAAPSRRHGTAASALGRWTAERMPGRIRWHIAKTGTTSVRAERLSTQRVSTRLAMVAGALALEGGGGYSYVVQAGPRGQAGHGAIGPGVYGGGVAVLAAPLLQSLVPPRQLAGDGAGSGARP